MATPISRCWVLPSPVAAEELSDSLVPDELQDRLEDHYFAFIKGELEKLDQSLETRRVNEEEWKGRQGGLTLEHDYVWLEDSRLERRALPIALSGRELLAAYLANHFKEHRNQYDMTQLQVFLRIYGNGRTHELECKVDSDLNIEGLHGHPSLGDSHVATIKQELETKLRYRPAYRGVAETDEWKMQWRIEGEVRRVGG